MQLKDKIDLSFLKSKKQTKDAEYMSKKKYVLPTMRPSSLPACKETE
jgi:hypothetical protein